MRLHSLGMLHMSKTMSMDTVESILMEEDSGFRLHCCRSGVGGLECRLSRSLEGLVASNVESVGSPGPLL